MTQKELENEIKNLKREIRMDYLAGGISLPPTMLEMGKNNTRNSGHGTKNTVRNLSKNEKKYNVNQQEHSLQ